VSSAAAPRKRYAAVATTVRRVWELDLGSAALVMAAQQLMCTIPLLVVLSAIHPASASANFGEQLARYLGLSTHAAHELKAVFVRDAQVRTATSIVGLILLGLFALGTAQAHERVYELAWRLDGGSAGAWHRRVRWVAALVGYVALVAGAGRLLGTRSSRWEFIAVCVPLTALFYWWGQRTLLAGRIRARSLVPGACLIAIGASGLLAVSPVLVSGQLTTSVREFGAIGVTFVLATWLLVLSALVVTGAVIGAEFTLYRGHAHPGRQLEQSSAEAPDSPAVGGRSSSSGPVVRS
jgi:membrane protein